MSGNAYKRTVLELEEVLEKKLAQVKILEDENTTLKRREAALSTAVGSVEGSVTAKTRVLRSKSLGEELAASPGGQRQHSVAEHVAKLSSDAMLAKVEQMETEIKRSMRLLGAGNYNKLYSTQLLHKAAADPQMVAAFLAASPEQRRADWAAAVRQLALLLPKYDYAFPCSLASADAGSSSSNLTARQQADSLVDEITSKILIYGLLDPPPVVLHDLMVNLEKGCVEPYPANYWKNVAAGLGLSTDQKHVLQFSWQKVKATKAAHQQLSLRLTQLQQEVHMGFKQFEQKVQAAMQDSHLEGVQEVQAQLQQQQQQSLAAAAAAAVDDDLLDLPDLQLPLEEVAVFGPGSPQLSDLLANWQEEDAMTHCPALHGWTPSFSLEQPPTAAAAAVVVVHGQQQQQQLLGGPPSPAVQLPTAEWQQQWIQQQQQQALDQQRQQQQRQQLQQQQPLGPTNPKEEVLLNVSGDEQRHLERELDRLRQHIKLQHFCQVLQLVNTISKKQLVTLYVLAWPYMPDAFILCEEMEHEAAAAQQAHSV